MTLQHLMNRNNRDYNQGRAAFCAEFPDDNLCAKPSSGWRELAVVGAVAGGIALVAACVAGGCEAVAAAAGGAYAAAGGTCLRFLRTCTAAIAGLEGALDAAGGKAEGRNSRISREELSPGQISNLTRYQKKLPSVAEDTAITRLSDGAVQFETRVPGRVPGSYALYTKTVDSGGKTIAYTKTTVLPDGTIAHTKDKFMP